MRARAGPARISGPGSDRKLGMVDKPGTTRLLLSLLSPLFCTKTCLPDRLARFFRAKRAGPARLGPLRARLGQEIEPAGLDGLAQNGPGFTGSDRAGPPIRPSLVLTGLVPTPIG
jgi:hypothetical protein